MRADAESSCTESRTDSWSQDGARNPWSAPTTELWAPTGSTRFSTYSADSERLYETVRRCFVFVPTILLAVPPPRSMPLASRQAKAMADNDRYWPDGFVDELTDELTAALEADSVGEFAFEFSKFEEKFSRAAVEITADLRHRRPHRAHGISQSIRRHQRGDQRPRRAPLPLMPHQRHRSPRTRRAGGRCGAQPPHHAQPRTCTASTTSPARGTTRRAPLGSRLPRRPTPRDHRPTSTYRPRDISDIGCPDGS